MLARRSQANNGVWSLKDEEGVYVCACDGSTLKGASG